MLILTSEAENPVFKEMQKSSQRNAQITYRVGKNVQKGEASFANFDSKNGTQNSLVSDSERPTPPSSPAISAFNTEIYHVKSFFFTAKDKITAFVRAKLHKDGEEYIRAYKKLSFGNGGVIKNKIDFEPHLKDITIFFSDIRGFTAISDGFKNRFGEKSAGEIIGFLNDYMSRIVACISATGGVVDKFEGDAIMAAWGVLQNESLDWEKLPSSSVERARKQAEHNANKKEDALSAITSCIAMRYSLMIIQQGRRGVHQGARKRAARKIQAAHKDWRGLEQRAGDGRLYGKLRQA